MLIEYLSSIANKLRELLGTSTKINAQDFPAKISEVYDAGYNKGIATGGGGGSPINPNWTDWRHFSFYNNRNDLVSKLKYTDTANGGNFSEMCFMCYELTSVPPIDVSNGTDFSRMFYFCENLVTVGHLDLTSGEGYDASQIFYQCKNLVNVSLEPNSFNTSSVDMSASTKLSKDSITSVVNALDIAVPEFAGLSLTLSGSAVGSAFWSLGDEGYNEWVDLVATKPNWTISLM